jgi:hypothetical protein
MTPKLAEVEERGQHTYNKTTHILRQSLSRYPKGQQAGGGDGKVETEGSAVGYDCGDDPNRAFDELMRCARTAHQELHNKINPGTVSYCNTPRNSVTMMWCGVVRHYTSKSILARYAIVMEFTATSLSIRHMCTGEC